MFLKDKKTGKNEIKEKKLKKKKRKSYEPVERIGKILQGKHPSSVSTRLVKFYSSLTTFWISYADLLMELAYSNEELVSCKHTTGSKNSNEKSRTDAL